MSGKLAEARSGSLLEFRFGKLPVSRNHTFLNLTVEGRHVESIDFATFGFDGVADGAEAELLGAEVFCVAADGVLDYVAGEAEVAGGGDAAEGDVDVGAAGVEVGDGDPFEVGV